MEQVHIPMTAPVSVLVQPSSISSSSSSGSSSDDRDETSCVFTMAFYLPAPFDEDPPTPTDPLVSIEFRPPINVVAR